MMFEDREHSLAEGQPVRLYRFSRCILVWLYCSGDQDVIYEGGTYKSFDGGVTDDGIRQTGDARSETLQITAPADLNVAQLFRGVPPSDRIGLSIFDMHYGLDDARLSWVGSIGSVNWPSLDRCRISCVPRSADGQDPGLVDTYVRTCQAVLGDTRCKVDLNPYRVEAPIQSMDGASIYSGAVEGYDEDWFTAGYIEWSVGIGEYDTRHIEKHAGNQLVLLGGSAGVPNGATVRVYPGCDFQATTCLNKFDNLPNMRAVPNLQGESPFDGNQVW